MEADSTRSASLFLALSLLSLRPLLFAALAQAQETMYGDEGQASATSLQGWEAPPALSHQR